MTDPTTIVQQICLLEAAWYPRAADCNARMVAAFETLDESRFQKRTHFIAGRFENLYLQQDALPGLTDILAFAQGQAARRLGTTAAELRSGFWLNAMRPGQRTSKHSHEENDELLSGVYYVTAPASSGDILFHDHPFETRVAPQAGLLLLFPPDLPHSVEPNRSGELRLSIAFNFGPAD
ncbi:MAG: putative 2OG-Fe(II) oxygenase [Thiohalocapsa sp.]